MIDDLSHLIHLPVKPVSLELGRIAGFLVMPMRGDTVFRDLVHRESPYLYFERRMIMAYDSRMDRLVFVLLGHRDVVFEAPGNVLVHLVDDTQYLIAFDDLINNDPAREKVIDLIDRLALVVHLLIDTVEMLGTAFNVVMGDAVLLKLRPDLGNNLLHEVLALRTVAAHESYELIELLGMQIFKAEILKLPLDPVDTEPCRERNVDIKCLLSFFYLLVRCLELECPHVMETVCQLDKDDPDVIRHRNEHLSYIRSLNVILRIVNDVIELQIEFCDAVNKVCDSFTELL